MPVGISLYDAQGRTKDVLKFTHTKEANGCGHETTITRMKDNQLTVEYQKLISDSTVNCSMCGQDVKYIKDTRVQIIMWDREVK
jgi:hypothetical protein